MVTAQLKLYDDPPAQAHSPTSVAAAESIKPIHKTLLEVVYLTIAFHGPCTDEEIAAAAEIAANTARPRRVELLKAGRIYQSGTRLTKSGRKAAAWRIVSE